MENRSAQVIEDVKWFMFGDMYEENVKQNDCGFEHCLEFIKWCGNSTSFVVSDGECNYVISCVKENKNESNI